MALPNQPKPAASQTVAHPSFGEAFRFWLKLGFISFGGPAGQIAIIAIGLSLGTSHTFPGRRLL